jgi:ubiquitin-conjugating enzyme E2 S
MTSENLPPQIISRLLTEVRDLVRNPVEGIEYLDKDAADDGAAFSSLAEVHAIIKGPEETPFLGGSFHMKLVLSDDYPNSPPRGFFLTKIYHPNVATNGDICVNTLKRDWTSDTTVRSHLDAIL